MMGPALDDYAREAARAVDVGLNWDTSDERVKQPYRAAAVAILEVARAALNAQTWEAMGDLDGLLAVWSSQGEHPAYIAKVFHDRTRYHLQRLSDHLNRRGALRTAELRSGAVDGPSKGEEPCPNREAASTGTPAGAAPTSPSPSTATKA